jgi:beta-alanine--pyruvate transaminase
MNARSEDFNTRALNREELEAFWMPFTANRQFKDNPRILSHAKGMHYWTTDGRQVLDSVAGLWCVNAGHGRREISQAVARQVEQMDYAPPFQMGHPLAFDLANKLKKMAPAGLDHVFFTNSGSESAETALKIAFQYQRLKGESTRTRLIGRERGYHGVNIGGTSLGGMVGNRKAWGPAMIPGIDHLPHTHNLAKNAFTKGQPEHGAELADALEGLVALHDASSIAAVIVEPVAGSAGVLPPPKGYLQRLREICTKYGILLIFDEVITGFGRTGSAFASLEFGVTPDIITCAKGLSNGTVPMGAVIVKKEIYDAFMAGPDGAVELYHGYTYSAHPVACAAAIATLDIYERDGIFQRVKKEIAPYWADAVHSLKGLPHVIDIRTYGLMACVEYEPIPGSPGKRGYDTFLRCFESGVLVRGAADGTALSPPLIVEKNQIDQIVDTLGKAIKATA